MTLSQKFDGEVNPMEFLRRRRREVEAIRSSNRLHTLFELRSMSKHERYLAFDRRIEQFSYELTGIMSGSILPWSGSTRSKLLRSCRRRLKRAELAARELGISWQTQEEKSAEWEADMREMGLGEICNA